MENLQHQFNRYFVDNGATEWWLTGLKTTLLVTVIALCIGVVLGLLIALIRSTHEQTGKLKLLNIVARVYLTIIRGTPSMIQILFFYSVIFATVNLNNIVIGGIAFGINSGAYVAEIFRSGIMEERRDFSEKMMEEADKITELYLQQQKFHERVFKTIGGVVTLALGVTVTMLGLKAIGSDEDLPQLDDENQNVA